MQTTAFYNNFQFIHHGKITESPINNRVGYAELDDGTIIELRAGVITLKPPVAPTDLIENQRFTFTFTIPEETLYPQAIHITRNPSQR